MEARLHSSLIVVAATAALLAAPAIAAQPTAPVYDSEGNLVDTPFAPRPEAPGLTEERATALFVEHPKVASWLDRYPPEPDTDATFDDEERTWEVKVRRGS
jgi:hypothetical protein